MNGTARWRARGNPERQVSRSMLETAHSLSVDVVTAEVVSAFAARSVPSLLLKGPSIANWLYSDGAARPYGDCDLLVPPAQAEQAEEILRSLGFRYGYESHGPGDLEAGLFWTRGSAEVDLHVSLQGIGADPEVVWGTLSAHVEETTVAGQPVMILDPAARAMHVALHAAQHGRHEATTMRDLERALDQVPWETWRRAAELAAQLDASSAFATGLALSPAGQAIADRLHLEPDTSVEGLLFAETAPTVAFTLERLRSTPGLAAKAMLLTRKAFPNRAYMRLYWPLARRGRIGLLLAYGQRLVAKLVALPWAVIAWRRARRATR